MSEFDWKIKAEEMFADQSSSSISRVFHENSKLPPSTARDFFPRRALSAEDLVLSSRGFRQYTNSMHREKLDEIIVSDEKIQDVMFRRRSGRNLRGTISRAELATLLYQSLGPSKLVPNEDYGLTQVLRTNPSAGGLFPLDTYVICNRVDQVRGGIYHYNVVLQELEMLSDQDPGWLLDQAFYSQDFISNSAVVVALAGSFLRSQVKYGERGYRLVLLDAGHAAQNLLLTAEQMQIAAVAVAGFCDDLIAEGLGIDGEEEAVIHCIVAGRSDERSIPDEG